MGSYNLKFSDEIDGKIVDVEFKTADTPRRLIAMARENLFEYDSVIIEFKESCVFTKNKNSRYDYAFKRLDKLEHDYVNKKNAERKVVYDKENSKFSVYTETKDKVWCETRYDSEDDAISYVNNLDRNKYRIIRVSQYRVPRKTKVSNKVIVKIIYEYDITSKFKKRNLIKNSK